MVRISGTLTSNVSLSGRMAGGQSHADQGAVQPVQKKEKPAALSPREPDLTFEGIGRRLDIRA
ncbi:hypothetical protein [Sneathiella chinensis]|uniref:Flagellar hook-length control protein-like C-terminal domain-containing protein n=1 Tax=Sneathiella chinensis TaxID=349750 RepID=A0ABQ5U9A1_9PROT|nr:hypothetical protein [Sneathiella chinensis]GLQ07824.1 hypothetical protein GCM10007924_30460 [Sneathiella chinensis]